jgi:ABC-type glycerol-3-phosphate transport system substrate-binding protein
MKRFIIIIVLALVFTLVSCGGSTSNPTSETSQPTTLESGTTSDNITTHSKEDDEIMNKTLFLKIGNTEVNVDWLDNDSVSALKNLAKDGLTIKMHMYGGFEQVGSLGTVITSADKKITTNPGDIVLYSSNQIVIFYDSNSWAYTKLGHINLSKNELADLLGNGDVTITISLK